MQGTSIYTVRYGLALPGLILVGTRLFPLLHFIIWNNLLSTPHVFLIDMTNFQIYLCFTSNPSHYNYTISAPLRSSDHNFASLSSKWIYPPPPTTCKRRLWHYGGADWRSMCEFFAGFPWSEHYFASQYDSTCADSITKVLWVGEHAFSPPPTKTTSS